MLVNAAAIQGQRGRRLRETPDIRTPPTFPMLTLLFMIKELCDETVIEIGATQSSYFNHAH